MGYEPDVASDGAEADYRERRQLIAALKAILADPSTAARPVALFVMAIDRFDTLNEIHGFEASEEILVATVDRLRTTTGESALHLADAEPIKRSRNDENKRTLTKSSGAGSAIACSTLAPLIAAIGPRLDQLNIATKCAANSAKTMYGAIDLMPSIILSMTSLALLTVPDAIP